MSDVHMVMKNVLGFVWNEVLVVYFKGCVPAFAWRD